MYGTAVANADRAMPGVDTGPRERAQHAGGVKLAPRTVTEGGIETSVGAQATFECVLDALFESDQLLGSQGAKADRQAIARSRYEAGKRFRMLFIDAGLVPVKAFDIGGVRGKGGDITDKEAECRRRFNALVAKLGVLGPAASGVCCFDVTSEHPAWIGTVQRALDRLCLEVW